MASNDNRGNSGKAKQKPSRAQAARNGKQAKPAKPAGTGSRSRAWIVISVVIIAAIVATGLFLLSNQGPSNSQVSFASFRNNFIAANSVAVYVDSSNESAYPSAIACATALVETVEANAATHKNITDLGFYVMNQTSCTYKPGGLGSVIVNYTNTTPSACLALSTGMPSIFINYSRTNSTVIEPYALRVSGTTSFLNECGIASEIK